MIRLAVALCLIVVLLSSVRAEGPETLKLKLEPAGRIECPVINESSGIVRSRQWPEVFWTHNDSGDRARIFAIDRMGHSIVPESLKSEYEGVEIPDAVNIDWEDIATDDAGNLIVAACGNNGNARRDLAVYVVPEPDPSQCLATRARCRIDFHYPDQNMTPDEPKNFDAEAIFWAAGRLYLLTKHRADTRTRLYRFDRSDPFVSNPLTPLGEFEIGGMVTGADATPDGTRLAILTYESIWLFEVDPGQTNYFEGRIHHLAIEAGQCEGITFEGPDLLVITNEQRDIFHVPVAQLTPWAVKNENSQ